VRFVCETAKVHTRGWGSFDYASSSPREDPAPPWMTSIVVSGECGVLDDPLEMKAQGPSTGLWIALPSAASLGMTVFLPANVN
jgi:hypothetical protein